MKNLIARLILSGLAFLAISSEVSARVVAPDFGKSVQLSDSIFLGEVTAARQIGPTTACTETSDDNDATNCNTVKIIANVLHEKTIIDKISKADSTKAKTLTVCVNAPLTVGASYVVFAKVSARPDECSVLALAAYRITYGDSDRLTRNAAAKSDDARVVIAVDGPHATFPMVPGVTYFENKVDIKFYDRKPDSDSKSLITYTYINLSDLISYIRSKR